MKIKERIYIASIHWNTEGLLRGGWIDRMVELVGSVRTFL